MKQPYKFTGLVHHIGRTQTFPSGFAKRLLVCKADDEDAKYPSYGAFEFLKGKGENAKDKTLELDRLSVGDRVEVSFYLDANENRNKPGQWFGSCKAAKVEIVVPAARNAQTPPPAEPEEGAEPDMDDVPF